MSPASQVGRWQWPVTLATGRMVATCFRLNLVDQVIAVAPVAVGLETMPQDLDYHLFADTRWLFGIPNFNNVMSNVGFALAGALGIVAVAGANRQVIFDEPADARPYLIFFVGVALVSLGSSYYHWEPSNERLLWDRLPMSVAFMALSSAIVSDRIHSRAGNTWLLRILSFVAMKALWGTCNRSTILCTRLIIPFLISK